MVEEAPAPPATYIYKIRALVYGGRRSGAARHLGAFRGIMPGVRLSDGGLQVSGLAPKFGGEGHTCTTDSSEVCLDSP